jgi:hypothetical protein
MHGIWKRILSAFTTKKSERFKETAYFDLKVTQCTPVETSRYPIAVHNFMCQNKKIEQRHKHKVTNEKLQRSKNFPSR